MPDQPVSWVPIELKTVAYRNFMAAVLNPPEIVTEHPEFTEREELILGRLSRDAAKSVLFSAKYGRGAEAFAALSADKGNPEQCPVKTCPVDGARLAHSYDKHEALCKWACPDCDYEWFIPRGQP